LAFKYNMDLSLTDFLSEKLLSAYHRYGEIADIDIIIPVPLYASKKRKRGFNQSEILAKKLADKLIRPMLTDVLVKSKRTKTQAFLNREQRIENVQNVFKCLDFERVKNLNVLLIDDVATTTSTLEACAVALKEAGAKNIYALTLARE